MMYDRNDWRARVQLFLIPPLVAIAVTAASFIAAILISRIG